MESAVRFIAEENPDAAVRFGNALIDRVAILENFPLLGPPYSKRPDVRKLVSRPYIIYYRSVNRKIPWTSCVTGMAHNANRNCDAPRAESGPSFDFYLGKNTPERKDYIMDSLGGPVED